MTTNQKGTIMGNTMEQERDLVNKFLDLVQEDIHNHTFTEENNR